MEPGLTNCYQLPRKFLRTMAGFQPDGMGDYCPGLGSSRGCGRDQRKDLPQLDLVLTASDCCSRAANSA
jgi:hypothetical protein